VSAKHKTLPKFAIGSLVRVKMGVTVPNGLHMPMGGWRGKVYEASGTVYLVHWSGDTLEAIRSIHCERWQRNGVDCRDMWLQERILEADPGRTVVR
jgi:hypothetical protein